MILRANRHQRDCLVRFTEEEGGSGEGHYMSIGAGQKDHGCSITTDALSEAAESAALGKAAPLQLEHAAESEFL